MRGVMKTTMRVSSRATARICTGFLVVAALILLLSTSSFGADSNNQLLSVAMDPATESPTVLIQTTEPVGYRYTVYDSYEPVRVVVDFPGMDMAEVKESLAVNEGVVQEVRVATFELSSGNLARVEVFLKENADYQVQLAGNTFQLVFAGQPTVAEKSTADPVLQKELQASAVKTVTDVTPTDMDTSANVLREVTMSPGQAILSTNGDFDRYKYFVLGNPPRLVIDLYGIRPGFKQRKFPAEAGMSQLRIGTYQDKTRLVFDAQDAELPKHSVTKIDTDLAVTWGNDVEPAAGPVSVTAESSTEPVAAAEPTKPVVKKTQTAPKMFLDKVSVEAIDFENQDGRSYVNITLSSPAEVTSAMREGALVRFDIKNATISRALRRTLDAAAFPTVIDTVDPYIVKAGETQDVRFAIKLKGEAAYRLEEEDNIVRLVVDDGPFAEAMPPQADVVEVDAPVVADGTIAADDKTVVLDETALEENGITGPSSAQKISLVFDSADVLSILQLIGDVSGMNILASDDVKGSVTLRLIDVPWDQALDLILETTSLGKIRQGNVLRIMPKEKIREMAQTDLQSQKQEIEEAPLVSRVFQISYSSVKDMEEVITDLLTERGNIIADARNKQLIVKDVPSVLDEMGELIMQIDKPDKQVMIEARIVEANTNFSRDMGVKWGFNYDNETEGVGTTNIDSAAVGLGGSFLLATPGAGGVGGSGGAADFSFGTVGLDTFTIDLRLSALEAAGKGKIVSTPRVTTLNGEEATIKQGTSIPYATTDDNGNPDTEFAEANLELVVTPEINTDGSVILDIHAKNDAIGVVVPTADGSAVSIDTKEAITKVLVHDGDTTVIGGIFIEDERDSDSGVPLLKDVPLLGRLFKSTSKTRERRELLIFITPRIIE